MKIRILSISGAVFASLMFFSCKKDTTPAPAPASTTAVFIGNQGAFANGAGTLSIYAPQQKSVNNNAFQKANTYTMGSRLQSIYVDGSNTFLVLNGSAEIVIMDSESHKVIKRIKGLGAPRNIMKVAQNKYYITDWQEQGVVIYNSVTGKLGKTITTGNGPENIAVYNDMAFVVNGGDGTPDSNMTIINTTADTVMAQIWAGQNPNSLAIDANKKLWVLSAGIVDPNPFLSTPGRLVSFDLTMDSLEYKLDSLFIEDTLTFADNQLKPTQMVINGKKNTLYMLGNATEANLYKFAVSDTGLSSTPFIQGSFNALGFDQTEGEIYLGDELDEIQAGDIYRYDEKAAQIDFFKAGLKPGCFGFK